MLTKGQVIPVALGVFLFVAAGVLLAATFTVEKGTPTAPLAMTLAQVGVLAFWWIPYRYAWRSAAPVVAWVFGALSFGVSLLILGSSAAILLEPPGSFLCWGPFLLVHVAANGLLMLRPRVYLWWILGVWGVGPMVIGGLFVLAALHTRFPPAVDVLIQSFTGTTGRGLDELPLGVFWLMSLGSFAGTAAGVGFALGWMAMRSQKEKRASLSFTAGGRP